MKNEPLFSWFVHALVNNIGRCEWIDKTEEELKESKEMGIDYPYKVIQHPIPPGKDIILQDSKQYRIECDSEGTRDLVIEVAQEYHKLSLEHQRLLSEKRAEIWHPASEDPCYRGPHSAEKFKRVLVTSPALQYVVLNGVCEGLFKTRTGKWYVIINGKKIAHTVTYWRHIPPPIGEAVPYEKVKNEVEKLRKFV